MELVEIRLAGFTPVAAMPGATAEGRSAGSAGTKPAGTKPAGTKAIAIETAVVVRMPPPAAVMVAEEHETDHPKQDQEDQDRQQQPDQAPVTRVRAPARECCAVRGGAYYDPDGKGAEGEQADESHEEQRGQKSEAASVSHLELLRSGSRCKVDRREHLPTLLRRLAIACE
jgi:hypothetical protein